MESKRRAPLSRDGGVVVSNARKVYGDVEALKGVSLRMERGEVTALLGECFALLLVKIVWQSFHRSEN